MTRAGQDPWTATRLRRSPFSGHRAAAFRVRDALERGRYEEACVLELLGAGALPSFRQRLRLKPELALRMPGDGPLETLVRLFLLGESVPIEAARRALAPARPEDAVEAGLLEGDPAVLRATVELTPYQGLVLAADWPGGLKADPLEVMGVVSSSRALAQMTVRRRAARSLDLGTGGGVLALLVARRSDRVVATDRNPRAIDFARFNAEWNRVSNVTFLAGDLFEPVAGETFDLIVCNPPFVIAPAVDYVHTHSGRPSDELCRQIVRAAPAHLSEGGVCQLVCNWAQVAGEDWRERVAGWVAGSGCDAWVLHSHFEDARTYASARIDETADDPTLLAARLEQWLAYYERERIEAVGVGLITLRRRKSVSHVFRCDRIADIAKATVSAEEAASAVRGFLEDAIRPPGA